MSGDFEFIQANMTEGSRRTALAMGAPESGKNFTGPNGERMEVTYRPASPIEQMTADKEMTLHGYRDRMMTYVTITAVQFANKPAAAEAWRSKNVVMEFGALNAGTVSQVETRDPFLYTFVIVSKQPPRNG